MRSGIKTDFPLSEPVSFHNQPSGLSHPQADWHSTQKTLKKMAHLFPFFSHFLHRLFSLSFFPPLLFSFSLSLSLRPVYGSATTTSDTMPLRAINIRLKHSTWQKDVFIPNTRGLTRALKPLMPFIFSLFFSPSLLFPLLLECRNSVFSH